MIALAEELNAELEAEIDVLKAAKLVSGPGTKPALTPTEEMLAVSQRLSDVLGQAAVVASYKKTVDSKLKELAQGDPKWEHLFERRSYAEKNTFNVAVLKKKYKALYEEYQRIAKVSVTKQFTINATEFEADSIYAELGLTEPENIGDDIIGLHQANLAHWSIDARLGWEQELLEAKLLTAASEAEGIEGILAWKTTESKNFDRKAFEVEHPVEFADSFKFTPATTTWRVAEWASYSG